MDTKNFACQENSNCVDSENKSGYFCKYFKGYEGNPYLPNGCQDINECETMSSCNGTCINLPGTFNCSCPVGYEGDGWKNGTGCSLPNKDKSERSPLIDIALDYINITMTNITELAIEDPSQVEQFINEIMVLYQINHKNVVKLLGCCLETQIPLLVYEYITNGTVCHHLHNDDAASHLPWETRLRIATEIAEALSYLHSAASIPIIHRDIKLANILLDENHTAKVSNFGASRLFPSDQAQITTIVQGTSGYLDPEYMLTSLLTEKSDVYSFGVVLMEMLTGQKVVCVKRSEEKNRLLDILDPRVLNDENVE
ncbi:wall-associated receptor kinase 5-like [Gossypium australe]|uniref:Wall-associated receptor kinase 5-like n=1 Tax=Gossypium australe TaxID=47621 RepID=A0A5B6WSW7_9ROSI|nr:wall-associated receptor kinase 5-like [Gossypium australe]